MSKRVEGLEEQVLKIIRQYRKSNDLMLSNAYPDGGSEPLFPRLERAAINQLSCGEATLSRYGIWANTVRDTIIDSIRELGDNPENCEVIKSLVKAANSLSAFADIQKLMEEASN
jgi:hypothetical protein